MGSESPIKRGQKLFYTITLKTGMRVKEGGFLLVNTGIPGGEDASQCRHFKKKKEKRALRAAHRSNTF